MRNLFSASALAPALRPSDVFEQLLHLGPKKIEFHIPPETNVRVEEGEGEEEEGEEEEEERKEPQEEAAGEALPTLQDVALCINVS